MADPKQTALPPRTSAPGIRSPYAPVLRDLPPEQRGAPIDWSLWYEDDDEHVAESCEQGAIIRELVSTLEQLALVRGWSRVYIGADTYFAWLPDHPKVRVSPDVYLLDDPPPPPLPRSWQTWKPGHRPPRWAVEVVSEGWVKDYREGPGKYAALGCAELVLFDPEAVLGQAKGAPRRPLTVLRRGHDGVMAEVYAGPGPAYSEQVGAWLQARREGYVARLRLSEDEAGQRRVPTRAQAEATRADAEATRADAEAARADAEATRAATEASRAASEASKAAAEASRADSEAARARDAEQRARELEERLRRLEGER